MKTYLSVILILLSSIVVAQNKQYIQVKGHLGSSGLVYPSDDALETGGAGFGTSISYHYFFNNNWILGCGFGVSNTKTTSTLAYYTNVTSGYVDIEGDVYDSHLYLYNWEEVQNTRLIEIPFTLSYQHKSSIIEGLSMYLESGFSFQFPFQGTYEVNQGVFENQGYYSEWNITLGEIPGYFEKTETYLPQGDFELKPCVSAIANIGLGYTVNTQIEFFAGINMAYYFGNMKDGGDSQLVTMSEDLEKSYVGLLNSAEVSQVNTRRIGLELGIRFMLFND